MVNSISKNLLSRNEAARYLGISLPTLSKLTAKGRLKSYRLGNLIKYKLEDLETALNASAK